MAAFFVCYVAAFDEWDWQAFVLWNCCIGDRIRC